jgi:hypothetical protein
MYHLTKKFYVRWLVWINIVTFVIVHLKSLTCISLLKFCFDNWEVIFLLDSGLDRLQLRDLSFNFFKKNSLTFVTRVLISVANCTATHFLNLVAFKLARASLLLHKTERQQKCNRKGCSIYCTSCQIQTFVTSCVDLWRALAIEEVFLSLSRPVHADFLISTFASLTKFLKLTLSRSVQTDFFWHSTLWDFD